MRPHLRGRRAVTWRRPAAPPQTPPAPRRSRLPEVPASHAVGTGKPTSTRCPNYGSDESTRIRRDRVPEPEPHARGEGAGRGSFPGAHRPAAGRGRGRRAGRRLRATAARAGLPGRPRRPHAPERAAGAPGGRGWADGPARTRRGAAAENRPRERGAQVARRGAGSWRGRGEGHPGATRAAPVRAGGPEPRRGARPAPRSSPSSSSPLPPRGAAARRKG